MVKKILKSYDYSLITVYILLCLFGLVMIYSASMVIGMQYYQVSSDYYYNKQLQHFFLSIFFFIFTAVFPYKAYKNNRFLMIIVLLSLLSALFVISFGYVSNNAGRWVEIGGKMIQPSEFIKLATIIYLGAIYTKKQSYLNEMNRGVFPPLIFLCVICFLILRQPDLGTAVITFAIGFTMIISSGMALKTILKLVGTGVFIIVLLLPLFLINKDIILTDGRVDRIEGFLDPFTSGDEGLQLVNSYLAIGSGGIKGQGLGQSVQKLGYLPEGHTDFIMAVIAEELGLFGVLFVIAGLAFLVLRGLYVGMKCKDPFGSLLAFGISSMIAIQTLINLGGVVGLIPITGVTLPFISYGGSSLLVLSMSLGILVNVSMFVRYEEKYKPGKEHLRPETMVSSNTKVTLKSRVHN
ncbi:FtsW/RodA/SpoVE family cell cycle protein [Bacillus chungangensis]|uniref:Probable peptidoglycan glycosyltransferase FtsW n=1 Tax=Bacillus chungangensis TaxID=587633 RepID=A0ABT9WUR8_9BACI|nr:FtsW/RodA/SpoVE family cell cycle protein [Bacillus chungangensis]MDQ0177025.1 cell division protein FtsW [Bacillus chungangensis]